MGTIYYNNLFTIDDDFRKAKYHDLLLKSLKNDFNKWTEKLKSDYAEYISPKYNDSMFIIECRFIGFVFAYVHHCTPLNKIDNELITNSPNKELKDEIQRLRENIFTPEIYEIEKALGGDTKQQRKNKLDALDIESLKNQIEDTYTDWVNSKNEITAKMISKIIFSYRRKEDLYDLWLEKFGNEELIMKELKNI